MLRWTSWLLAGVLLTAAVGETTRAPDAAAGVAAGHEAAQEALLAAPLLAAENARLREQVAALEALVGELTVSLAEARFERDRLGVQVERLPAAAGAAELAATAMAVLDVNRGLGLVVLDAGTAAGIRPGMVFGVLRADEVIARVRTVDVRERIAGAKVEALTSDVYPERGDRAVVWRSTTR